MNLQQLAAHRDRFRGMRRLEVLEVWIVIAQSLLSS